MGLTRDIFRFEGDVPTEAELESHLRNSVGSTAGLESLAADGNRVTLYCMLEWFGSITSEYARAFLIARGGVRVDRSGDPAPIELPPYVARPWRDWGFLQRLRFRMWARRPVDTPITDGRYR